MSHGKLDHILRSKRLPKLNRAKISFHHLCGSFLEETRPDVSDLRWKKMMRSEF